MRQLKIKRTYIGKNSDNQRLNVGLYDEDDPRLFITSGLLPELLGYAYAEWVGDTKEEEKAPPPNYADMTIEALKAIAKQRSLTGYAGANKTQLVALIEGDDNKPDYKGMTLQELRTRVKAHDVSYIKQGTQSIDVGSAPRNVLISFLEAQDTMPEKLTT